MQQTKRLQDAFESVLPESMFDDEWKRLGMIYDISLPKKDRNVITEKRLAQMFAHFYKNSPLTDQQIHHILMQRHSDNDFSLSALSVCFYKRIHELSEILNANDFFYKYYTFIAREMLVIAEKIRTVKNYRINVIKEIRKLMPEPVLEQDKDGHIYCVQEREFIRLNEPVYKVGRTKNLFQRIGDYPNGSTLHFSRTVKNAKTCEYNILSVLRNTEGIVYRRDLGKEYFQGDLDTILEIVNQISRT